MFDHGFFLTRNAVRRQLAAMPQELYELRLIHSATARACPGERLWTATILCQPSTIRFLRARNREGFEIYFRPFAGALNSGYILVDLDHAGSHALPAMRAHGHQPCVVVETSPGHLQAWVRVSSAPLEPARASAIGKHLAHLYQGDPASTDWRHVGRLAGFTNQKPTRRQPSGHPPWVRLLHAQLGVATNAAALLDATAVAASQKASNWDCSASPLPPGDASSLYQLWLRRLRIPQRFPCPDWSIADLWIAKELLRRRSLPAHVYDVLRFGSPGFPRRHGDPHAYLLRTLARAALDLESASVPRPELPGPLTHPTPPAAFPRLAPRPLCGPAAAFSATAPTTAFRSYSTGGTYPSAE